MRRLRPKFQLLYYIKKYKKVLKTRFMKDDMSVTCLHIVTGLMQPVIKREDELVTFFKLRKNEYLVKTEFEHLFGC